MKKVIIAIDSFKGSLSSREVAEAFEQGFRPYHPTCDIRKVAIADGGEGMVEALVGTLGGVFIQIKVSNPLHRPIVARYGVIDNGKTAIIEIAAASGLSLLKAEERNPLLTSTYGTGELIADAIRRGCRNFLIGLGGSATNDAGTGLFRALGYRFIAGTGEELTGGGEILERIVDIDDRSVMPELAECRFKVACDVTNRLFGLFGAAYTFAPQKGADKEMVEQLDDGLRNFSRVVAGYNGTMLPLVEGAGAAGGVGGGMLALANAKLVRGIDLVLEAMHFDRIIEGSDLVITGEGRIDSQTVMGKAPSGVLKAATRQGIPTIAIGGGIEWCKVLQTSGFAAIETVTPEGMTLEEAMRPEVAKANIRLTAERIAKRYINQ